MKVNGRIIRKKGEEFIYILMGVNLKENLRMM
jgi:hypothetical protein